MSGPQGAFDDSGDDTLQTVTFRARFVHDESLYLTDFQWNIEVYRSLIFVGVFDGYHSRGQSYRSDDPAEQQLIEEGWLTKNATLAGDIAASARMRRISYRSPLDLVADVETLSTTAAAIIATWTGIYVLIQNARRHHHRVNRDIRLLKSEGFQSVRESVSYGSEAYEAVRTVSHHEDVARMGTGVLDLIEVDGQPTADPSDGDPR